MQIADLFARIGVKADDAQVKRFDKGLKNLKLGMTAATVVAGGVSLAIRKITIDAMNSAVAFKQFETETGASAQTLQKWQSVAEQTNQSAESVSNAIKAIAANQEKIKLGQGNISGYQLLGIDPNQDPFEVLEDLRTKTEGLNDAMKKNILSQMGIGAGMLQTLSLSRKEFDTMASRAFIISPHAIETLNKTKSSVDLASRAIKYIKAQIAVGLSPQITKLTKQFTAFIKVNERGIIKGFQQAYKYVNLFMGAVSNTWRIINNVVSATVGWERALKGIAIGFAAFNLILMASPLNMMIAGIILLIAVMDDLYVYSKGGNSLFGKMMDSEGMQKFTGFFKDIFGGIKDTIHMLDTMSLDDVVEQFGAMAGWMKLIVEGAIKLKELISGTVVGEMGDFVKESKTDPSKGLALDAVNTGISAAMGPGAGFGAGIFQKILEKFAGGGANNTDVNIQVDGAGDPAAVGASVYNEFSRAMTGAQAQRSRDE